MMPYVCTYLVDVTTFRDGRGRRWLISSRASASYLLTRNTFTFRAASIATPAAATPPPPDTSLAGFA